MSYYPNRTSDGRPYGPCYCGAIDCPSCGPAQGYPIGYTDDDDTEPYTMIEANDEAEVEQCQNAYAIGWWLNKSASEDPAALFPPLVRGRSADSADTADFNRLLTTLMSINYDDVILAAVRELRARYVKAHAAEISDRAAELVKANA